MTWVKIDDGFSEHPKVVTAGPLAGWLHICGLCYCNRNLTDGFVPTAVANRLADFSHIDIETAGVPGMFSVGVDVDCPMLIEVLLEVGMWEEAPGGYLIHDYLDYNPSKTDVLAKRDAISKARSEAGKKGANARWDSKHDGKPIANEWQEEWQSDGPVPVPLPIPPAEEELYEGSGSSSTEDPAISNLEPALELEITKLIAEVTGKDNRSADVLRRFAAKLPLGAVVKVRESASGKSARYAVGALKDELRERGQL